jgi:hypothetical protein
MKYKKTDTKRREVESIENGKNGITAKPKMIFNAVP